MIKSIILTFILLFGNNCSAETFVIDFYADWCGPCKQMDKNWETPEVKQFLGKEKIKLVKLDVDKFPQYSKMWGVTTIPCTIVIDVENGKSKEIGRKVGYMSPGKLIEFIAR